MDFLKAAINNSKAKLKRSHDTIDNNNSNNDTNGNVKKFKTRGEIEAEKREKQEKQQVNKKHIHNDIKHNYQLSWLV